LYLDADGIVAAARASTLLIEHSTITPELAQRIAERAVSRGLHVVDAPVSGGPEGAMQGTLAIMVGGSAAAFARAEGILRAYGRTVVHMGGGGAGMQAKLVSQLLTFAHGAAAAEAVALAQRIGLELGALGEVLRAGFGQSRMLDRTLTRVQEGAYEAGAALVLFDKDLGLLSAMGARHETALPMTDALQAIVHAAIARGLGGEDISALRLQYPGAIRPDPA
jgi:3-hydroxyisobutyrate dehydrogenase-like beta-hydroxyacid dehydrogenase